MYNRDKIINVMKEIIEESKSIKPYVIILQPRRNLDETPVQFLNGASGIHVDMLGFSHAFCDLGGEFVDVSRNFLLERALESGAKYALFAGEDTCLQWDTFLQLHKTAQKYNDTAMVTGVYWIKGSSQMVMCRDQDFIYPSNVDSGQEIEIWQAGLDCCLIPMKIIQKLKEDEPELPFCCIGHPQNDPEISEFLGEDNFLYFRIRKAGFKIICNTDVQAIHVDISTGKYSCHPDITPEMIKDNYYTNFPITERITIKDKKFLDERWISRLPQSKKAENELQKNI